MLQVDMGRVVLHNTCVYLSNSASESVNIVNIFNQGCDSAG